MARALNAASQEKIKGYEGLRLTAYDDANPSKVLAPGDEIQGTLTIGYGHTGDVTIGQIITLEQAQKFFDSDTAESCRCVEDNVKVSLSDNQFGALVSFVYNIGCTPFVGSTLLKKLNAGDYNSVPVELRRWNKQHVNGKVVIDDGLTIRRASECGLWALGQTARGANITPEIPPPMWRVVLSSAHMKLKALGTSVAGLGLGADHLEALGNKAQQHADMWHGFATFGVILIGVGLAVELFRPKTDA